MDVGAGEIVNGAGEIDVGAGKLETRCQCGTVMSVRVKSEWVREK